MLTDVTVQPVRVQVIQELVTRLSQKYSTLIRVWWGCQGKLELDQLRFFFFFS